MPKKKNRLTLSLTKENATFEVWIPAKVLKAIAKSKKLTPEQIAEFQGMVDERWKRLQWAASYEKQ